MVPHGPGIAGPSLSRNRSWGCRPLCWRPSSSSPNRGVAWCPVPRLRERLHQGLAAKLMLVSAPAGFGKTTLLVDWMAAVSESPDIGTATAWLSLDAGDNDPATFWTYVIAALRTVAPDIGTAALGLLQEPQPPPFQIVLTTLLNDLGAADVDLVLLLDDYHVIDSLEVQAGMAFLLDHLPPAAAPGDRQSRRPGPAAPPDAGTRRPRRGPRGRPALHRPTRRRPTSTTPWDCSSPRRTSQPWRGAPRAGSPRSSSPRSRWPGATTSPPSSPDSRATTGTSWTTWSRRSCNASRNDVQTFLLQTSVLDRMNGPLCDAVTGQDGGRAMLEALDRDNLFLVPLDDRRQWYRYHHLFADVLQARLLDEQPERVGQLHRLASDWYEQNGDRPRRSGTRWPAGDFAGRGRPDRAGRSPPCAGTGARRPCAAGSRRCPTTCCGPGRCSATTWPARGCPPAPSRGSRRCSTRPSDGWPAPTSGADRRCRGGPGGVPPAAGRDRRPPRRAGARAAATSRPRSPSPGSALEVALPDDHLARGAASALLGLAAWTKGDLELAHASYAGVPGRLRADRPRLRRARLLDHAGRHPGDARVVSARRCAPTSRRWTWLPGRALRRCAGPWTCTSAWPPSTGSSTTCRRPGAT